MVSLRHNIKQAWLVDAEFRKREDEQGKKSMQKWMEGNWNSRNEKCDILWCFTITYVKWKQRVVIDNELSLHNSFWVLYANGWEKCSGLWLCKRDYVNYCDFFLCRSYVILDLVSDFFSISINFVDYVNQEAAFLVDGGCLIGDY